MNDDNYSIPKTPEPKAEFEGFVYSPACLVPKGSVSECEGSSLPTQFRRLTDEEMASIPKFEWPLDDQPQRLKVPAGLQLDSRVDHIEHRLAMIERLLGLNRRGG